MFRVECPEIPARVISDALLHNWLVIGDKDICAKTRCIIDQDGTTITTAENDQYYDLTSKISSFYDIDEFPGGGVTYNDERLTKTTIGALDKERKSWRSNAAGTPKKYYRRGKYIYLDRAIDSNAYDLKVYAILISDDFDSNVTPFNQLTYLEPFHYGLVKWLKWKAKEKVGKRQDAINAGAEYIDFATQMKNTLGGGKFGPIQFTAPYGALGLSYEKR